MIGVNFKQSNMLLRGPDGSRGVYDLPVFSTAKANLHIDSDLPVQVISCWKMSLRERLACLFTGKVWFVCLGATHPPITIETKNPIKDV